MLARGHFGKTLYKFTSHTARRSNRLNKCKFLALLKCRHSQSHVLLALHEQSLTTKQKRAYHHFSRNAAGVLPQGQIVPLTVTSSRGIYMAVARVLKNVLKLRYLVLGGAVGGGLQLQKTYQDWKNSLFDVDWMKDLFPEPDKWNSVRDSMMTAAGKLKDVEIDPRLRTVAESKYQNMKSWLDTRWEAAYAAAQKRQAERAEKLSLEDVTDVVNQLATELKEAATVQAITFGKTENTQSNPKDFMEVQLKYQRELEKLEKENKELRKQLLLKNSSSGQLKKVKKSLIDMYSEVLDELSEFDASYQTQDHLPKVVVVGDQSAGKTSVLEMIAEARIFPRGAGEMMTRSPVKVTLSEGPYHIAQFKDSNREFDLTKESDLADLRKEVELRMIHSVKGGRTISKNVISMTVKGPGLCRMVLIDLPGIISTTTQDMESDTKELIREMTTTYMSNPNAIILCIQDGAVDAERSNVTDLVSQVDPQGKRTIFVLTKVDLAEQNLANPDRIQKILSGKLFPMKALGYFAVVTGRGNKEDSIQDIKKYEENFFRNSKLFGSNPSLSSQVTTRNLSLAVSDRFWKMVRETVEQQADALKAIRLNLKTEWKNKFPNVRELDRDELFERARGEILDEIVNLSQLTPKEWEELLYHKLWDRISPQIFENIFLPAAQTNLDPKSFITQVDIKLNQWAGKEMPTKTIEAGWEALRMELLQFMDKAKHRKEHDTTFDELKNAVIEEAVRRHSWESKGYEMIQLLQRNALDETTVHDKSSWSAACQFLKTSVENKLNSIEKTMSEMFGPGVMSQWMTWSYRTDIQKVRSAVKYEVEQYLKSNENHGSILSRDEMITIKQNLGKNGMECEDALIKEVWDIIFKKQFLQSCLQKAKGCEKEFSKYQFGISSEDCCNVVFFWKLQNLLNISANALRQQITSREARRLFKEIKEVLEEYSLDEQKKTQLLTGRRVTLAEELKRVRQVQEKLEEFIKALNNEK